MGDRKISGLKFADDIAMVAESVVGMREMFKALQKYTERNKLEVNVEKTKIMIFRREGKIRKSEQWYLGGKALKIVSKYKYLGFQFSIKNAHKDTQPQTGNVKK